MTDEPLRIGVLGAARIAELSIMGLARDRVRAEAFAAEHGAERVVASYAALVADPEIEVVYNPPPDSVRGHPHLAALANGLHGPWNLAALQAGKHVLTEKPSASNAEEAAEVRDAAARAGTVFMEGFHHLFHPVTRCLHELLDSGELGKLRRAETMAAMPAPPDDDVRWSLPPSAARGGRRTGAGDDDEWLYAGLEFPGIATGTARCHMGHHEWQISCRVVGTRGEATALNYVQPHLDDRVVVRTAAGEHTEELGRRSSYTYQLEAFAAHLRHGAPLALDAEDALTTMRLIDGCYRAAGFPVRPRSVLASREGGKYDGITRYAQRGRPRQPRGTRPTAVRRLPSASVEQQPDGQKRVVAPPGVRALGRVRGRRRRPVAFTDGCSCPTTALANRDTVPLIFGTVFRLGAHPVVTASESAPPTHPRGSGTLRK